jgi:hypothetical protein
MQVTVTVAGSAPDFAKNTLDNFRFFHLAVLIHDGNDDLIRKLSLLQKWEKTLPLLIISKTGFLLGNGATRMIGEGCGAEEMQNTIRLMLQRKRGPMRGMKRVKRVESVGTEVAHAC